MFNAPADALRLAAPKALIRRARDRADVLTFERPFEEPFHDHRFERDARVPRTDLEARGYAFNGRGKRRR
jgi:hypothetical protein